MPMHLFLWVTWRTLVVCWSSSSKVCDQLSFPSGKNKEVSKRLHWNICHSVSKTTQSFLCLRRYYLVTVHFLLDHCWSPLSSTQDCLLYLPRLNYTKISFQYPLLLSATQITPAHIANHYSQPKHLSHGTKNVKCLETCLLYTSDAADER